jgi:hypothetical protein
VDATVVRTKIGRVNALAGVLSDEDIHYVCVRNAAHEEASSRVAYEDIFSSSDFSPEAFFEIFKLDNIMLRLEEMSATKKKTIAFITQKEANDIQKDDCGMDFENRELAFFYAVDSFFSQKKLLERFLRRSEFVLAIDHTDRGAIQLGDKFLPKPINIDLRAVSFGHITAAHLLDTEKLRMITDNYSTICYLNNCLRGALTQEDFDLLQKVCCEEGLSIQLALVFSAFDDSLPDILGLRECVRHGSVRVEANMPGS